MSDNAHLYDIRKQLHQIPEPAFKEFLTNEFIIKLFADCPLLQMTKFDPTGLLFRYSHGSGAYMLFRADMDALPISEDTGCDFPSRHDGFAHACGHDIHLSVLIGLIQYVIFTRPKLNILFLFQPAEEGHGGAKYIIDTGIFDSFEIKSAYALHVTSQFPTGSIAVKSGVIFGIPQEFNIEFFGRAGHVATPQKGRDAFLASVDFISTVQTLISKRFPAIEPVIFHVGKVTAGTVRNVIPAYALLEGTHRTLKSEVRDSVNEVMHTVAKSVQQCHDIEVKVTLLSTYEPVVNDEQLTYSFLRSIPTGIHVIQAEHAMTGEDFGFFSQLYPSVLFWLGADSNGDLHSPTFLPDEKCIDVAMAIYKAILENE
jgi:N-acetyldiaminopimelate deacetylase